MRAMVDPNEAQSVAASAEDASLLGFRGETAVCLDFMRLGLYAVANVVPGSPYDVIADVGDEGFLRVQVKSTTVLAKTEWLEARSDRPGRNTRRRRRKRWRFKLGDSAEEVRRRYSGHVDLYAFVVLGPTSETTVYVTPGELTPTGEIPSRKDFAPSSFSAQAPGSLQRALAKLLLE